MSRSNGLANDGRGPSHEQIATQVVYASFLVNWLLEVMPCEVSLGLICEGRWLGFHEQVPGAFVSFRRASESICLWRTECPSNNHCWRNEIRLILEAARLAMNLIRLCPCRSMKRVDLTLVFLSNLEVLGSPRARRWVRSPCMGLRPCLCTYWLHYSRIIVTGGRLIAKEKL